MANKSTKKQTDKLATLPVLAIRGMVMFPNMILHFDVSREKSIRALHNAMNANRQILLLSQKDPGENDIETDNLYSVGVVSEIRQIVRSDNDKIRVVVEGLYRVKLVEFTETSPLLMATVRALNYRQVYADPVVMEATMNALKSSFSEYADISPSMPKELVSDILLSKNPIQLGEFIASNIPLDFDQKQKILEDSGVLSRLEKLLSILLHEIEIMSVEGKILEQTKQSLDKNQREYYLREQLKIINDELGGGTEAIIAKYREGIMALKLDEKSESKLLQELGKLEYLSPTSHEGSLIKIYLDTVLELPWGVLSKDRITVEKAKKQLDKDHYGLEKVKERILESLAVRILTGGSGNTIICLVGPPGVGKTSVAKSIAEAMGRKYVRLSLGGVSDESDIRGHRRTYVASMPGRIINSLKQAGTQNPLMLLDEIDKLTSNMRGDPSAAMLEVLDGEQNKAFRDHYIEVPFDLSKVFFIATANDPDFIPAPLRDRMEMIYLSSYTREEKFNIAKKHLLPKQLKKHGLKPSQLTINNSALYEIIDSYTKEAGVRTLERMLAKICRKVDMKLLSNKDFDKARISVKDLQEYLGTPKYKDYDTFKTDDIGIVNGLAWTSVGGELLQAEVAVLDGKGNNQMTGSLGDVMKESVSAALTCIRARAVKYGIAEDFYQNKDIHIHFPEGAVPKDGPSAGVTICTAMVSALAGIPVRHDVAMTGEITLRGNVLPIGGLKEKTMAAYKHGIKKVIIPYANISDLDEVEQIVKDNIEFVSAKTIDTVLETALAYLPTKLDTKKDTAQHINTVISGSENISSDLAH